jgi:hypothetical protein
MKSNVYVVDSVDILLRAPEAHKCRWARNGTLFYARDTRCHWCFTEFGTFLRWYRP